MGATREGVASQRGVLVPSRLHRDRCRGALVRRGGRAILECPRSRSVLRRRGVGERPLDGREVLDEATRSFEAIALGLRRVEGLSRQRFTAEFGEDPVKRHRERSPTRSTAACSRSTAMSCGSPRPGGCLRARPWCRRLRRRRDGTPPDAVPGGVLRGVQAGAVDRAFRRWERPRVRAGGRQRTAIGVIGFESVEPVARECLAEEDARRAGFASLRDLLAFVDRRPTGSIYRIGLRLEGPDPRVALRESVPDEPARLRSSARSTAWTARAATERGPRPCCTPSASGPAPRPRSSRPDSVARRWPSSSTCAS